MGELRAIMNGAEAQDKVVELSKAAEHFISVLCFTLDREDMAEAWKNAVRRGVDVEVGVDREWTLSGRCTGQYPLVLSLVSAGVRVRLLRGTDRGTAYAAVGRSFRGIGSQHAKIVHTDKGAVIGSTNFTTNSRGNYEVSAYVTLRDSAARVWKYKLSAAIAAGEPLEAAEKGRNIKRYCQRSRSMDARRSLTLPDTAPGGIASD